MTDHYFDLCNAYADIYHYNIPSIWEVDKFCSLKHAFNGGAAFSYTVG